MKTLNGNFARVLQLESTFYVLKTAVLSCSSDCLSCPFMFIFLSCSSHFLSCLSDCLSFSSRFHLVSFQVSFAFIVISFPSIFISLICCKFVVYTANCTVFVSMKAFNGNCARVLQLESTIYVLKTVVFSFSLHCHLAAFHFLSFSSDFLSLSSHFLLCSSYFLSKPFILISFPFIFIRLPCCKFWCTVNCTVVASMKTLNGNCARVLQLESTFYVLKTAVLSCSSDCLSCPFMFISFPFMFISFAFMFISCPSIFISFPSIFISLICCKFVVYTANCTVFVSMKAFNGNCARVLQLESTIYVLKTAVLSCSSDCLSCPFMFISCPFKFISFPFKSFHFPLISFHFHIISFQVSFPFIFFSFLFKPSHVHLVSFHFLSFPFISFHFLSFPFISFHFLSFPFIFIQFPFIVISLLCCKLSDFWVF